MPLFGIDLKPGYITHCLYCKSKKKKRYWLWGEKVCKNEKCPMHYKSDKLKRAQKRRHESRQEYAQRILNHNELFVNNRTMNERFYGPHPTYQVRPGAEDRDTVTLHDVERRGQHRDPERGPTNEERIAAREANQTQEMDTDETPND